MPNPQRHFFVCTNRRDPEADMPSCGPHGAADVFEGLQRARIRHGLISQVFITRSECLGPCPRTGATVVVYPEGVWYTGVLPEDVEELAERHMVAGEVVTRLRDPNWGNATP